MSVRCQTFSNLVCGHRDHLDRCLAAYGWAFEARQVLRVDCRLKRRNGADRRGTVWGMARTGVQGHFEGYVAFWLDGAERTQAEQVLDEKSKALRFAALESLPGKVVVIAKDARVLAAKESPPGLGALV